MLGARPLRPEATTPGTDRLAAEGVMVWMYDAELAFLERGPRPKEIRLTREEIRRLRALGYIQ